MVRIRNAFNQRIVISAAVGDGSVWAVCQITGLWILTLWGNKNDEVAVVPQAAPHGNVWWWCMCHRCSFHIIAHNRIQASNTSIVSHFGKGFFFCCCCMTLPCLFDWYSVVVNGHTELDSTGLCWQIFWLSDSSCVRQCSFCESSSTVQCHWEYCDIMWQVTWWPYRFPFTYTQHIYIFKH